MQQLPPLLQQQFLQQQQSFFAQPSVTQHHSLVGQQQLIQQQHSLDFQHQPVAGQQYTLAAQQQQLIQQQSQPPFIFQTCRSSGLRCSRQHCSNCSSVCYSSSNRCCCLSSQQMHATGQSPAAFWQPGSQGLANIASLSYAAAAPTPQQFPSLLTCSQLQLFQTLIESGIPTPLAQEIASRQTSNQIPAVYLSAFPPAPIQVPITPVHGLVPSPDMTAMSSVIVPAVLAGVGAQHTISPVDKMPANAQQAYYQMMQLLAQPNPLITPEVLRSMFDEAMLPMINAAGGKPSEIAPESLKGNVQPPVCMNVNDNCRSLAGCSVSVTSTLSCQSLIASHDTLNTLSNAQVENAVQGRKSPDLNETEPVHGLVLPAEICHPCNM